MPKKFDPKAKAKKQKIIAAVLGVLLLGVLAYEVPSLMKSMNKKPPSAAVAQPPPPGTPIAGAPVVPVAGAPVAVPAATTGTRAAESGSSAVRVATSARMRRGPRARHGTTARRSPRRSPARSSTARSRAS